MKVVHVVTVGLLAVVSSRALVSAVAAIADGQIGRVSRPEVPTSGIAMIRWSVLVAAGARARNAASVAEGIAARAGSGGLHNGVMPGSVERFAVVDVAPSEARFKPVSDLAASILNQDRYLRRDYPHAIESHLFAVFEDDVCLGFLRFLVQVIGAEEGRPPVLRDGAPLKEGFVEAFGVDPAARRRGIGSALQARAISYCREVGCHQMRSRSPVTSVENYALKVEAGYVLTPSEQNDSYYFLLKL